MASKTLINLSNLQKFLLKLNEKFALKKAMKGISEDSEGNIIIGEEGLVPTPNENSKGKFLRSDGEWALPSETAVYDSMRIEEGVAGVSEVDKVLNAKNLKQIVNSDGFLTSLDSSKLTGVINIENLPQGALERILIVSSKEERLTLSDTEVQLGDVVKEADTGLMYYVINIEKLNSEEGYTQFTAGMASSVPWSGVTDKPSIPTKTSDLTNDSNFAIDGNVVHKTGDEYINGTKMFSNTIHRYADLTTSTVETVYRSVDTNANPCGHIYNNVHWHNNAVYNRHGSYNAKSGKTLELDLITNGLGRGTAYISGSVTDLGNLTDATHRIDERAIATMGWVNNPATSTNVVHRTGDETINGNKSFSNNVDVGGSLTSWDAIYQKNSAIDLNVNPSSAQYKHFLFTDKNNVVMAYLEHVQTTTGVNALGVITRDKNNGSHGLQVTSEDNVIPLGDGVVNLGLSGSKWKNVYSTNNITNMVVTYSVTNHNNTSSMTVSGGSSWDKGSTLFLYGNSHSNYPGAFNLTAKNTTNESKLIGFPNGTLTWNGKNIALDENLVHRSGDETITGKKTFSNRVAFPSGYYMTTYANDNSLRIIRDGSNHGNNYKIIIQGDTGKIFAPNGFIGNLQGNADTATSATYATSAGSANLVAWANVTGKPNLATTTFVKGTNYWYRKHSDGFIEMGGFTNCADNPGLVVGTNLPIAFSNTNYTLSVQLTRGTGSDYILQTTSSKSTTRFEVCVNDVGSPGSKRGGFDWYACGY